MDEELILESLWRHSEVEEGDLNANLGQVMRIGQLRCQEEKEVIVVADLGISNFDHILVVLPDDILGKDGLKRWVQSLSNVLKKYREAHLDGCLNSEKEFGLRKFDYLQTVILLFVLNPTITLGLRIDYQRPSRIWVGRNYTVIDRKIICG